ncbi:MAG: hypothetical protein JNM18_19785 [Planctomycetaceae bacterium]|nr:hypothetical protein [Planctomycetaceae bacterium]
MLSTSLKFCGNFRHSAGGWLSVDLSMSGPVIAADALAWGVNRPGNVRCVYDSDGLRMQVELPSDSSNGHRDETFARLQHWLNGERPVEYHADQPWQAWLIDSVPRATLDGDRGRISSAVAGDPEIQVCAVAGQLQLSIELQPVAPLTGICRAALAEFLWAAHSRFRMVRAELDTHARLVSRLDFDQLEAMCPIAIKQLQTTARRIRKTVETLAQEHVAVAYLER